MTHPFLFLRKPVVGEGAVNAETLKTDKKKLLKNFRECYVKAGVILSSELKKMWSSRHLYLDYRQRGGASLVEVAACIDGSFDDGGLLVGLADSGAVENVGLFHDHLTGVPIYPASALKGILRHSAEENINEDGFLSNHEICFVFGSQEHAGNVEFLDAYPYERPEINLDITTVHQPINYNAINPPADWNEPNPVFFLKLSKAKFVFNIIFDNEKAEKNKCFNLSEKMIKLLEYAFEYKGLGAKTSSGYGFFERQQDLENQFLGRRKEAVEKRLRQIQEAEKKKRKKQLENMTLPEQLTAEMEEGEYEKDSEEKHQYVIKKYYEKIDSLPSEEAFQLAVQLKKLWQQTKHWKLPKNEKKMKKQEEKCLKIAKICGRS